MSHPSSPMNENKILTKLEKLLALSDSPNQHEAEAAMEKAIQLATQNNIDLSRVSAQNRPKDQIENEELSANASRLPITHLFVADILKQFFSVRIVSGGGRISGRRLYFIGRKSDIENAKFLYGFLNTTFMRLWHGHYKKNPHLNLATARQGYLLGLWQGLTAKLKAAKAAAEQTLHTEERHGYQIMIVDHEKALQNAITNFFPDAKTIKSKTRRDVDDDSLKAGYRDGGNINLQRGLTNEEKIQICA